MFRPLEWNYSVALTRQNETAAKYFCIVILCENDACLVGRGLLCNLNSAVRSKT
jgi:hypothetical protein